jgi:outer membrane protein
MKKIVTILLVAAGLVLSSNRSEAQTKFGYISLGELYPAMGEYKKADTSMNEYRNALGQQYEDMMKEYREQDSLINSKDTVKYTKAQLELKRRNVNEMLVKLQGWNTQAQQMLEQKQQELMSPIQKKALETIQAVAKENGFTHIFAKEALLVSPPAEDILPLVKKKLGLK